MSIEKQSLGCNQKITKIFSRKKRQNCRDRPIISATVVIQYLIRMAWLEQVTLQKTVEEEVVNVTCRSPSSPEHHKNICCGGRRENALVSLLRASWMTRPTDMLLLKMAQAMEGGGIVTSDVTHQPNVQNGGRSLSRDDAK